jgi:hypothetical protein
MSATITDSGGFELRKTERRDQRLSPRLEASKPAELIEVQVESITKQMRRTQPRKARELEQENRKALTEQLVHYAKKLAGIEDGNDDVPRPRVIGVVVNRVATARAVFDKLRDKKENELERDVILLTGRIRLATGCLTNGCQTSRPAATRNRNGPFSR